MTTKITNSAGVTVSGLSLAPGQEIALRAYPGEVCKYLGVSVTRIDFGEISPESEAAGSAVFSGQELVDSGAVEIKLPGGEWKPVKGNEYAFDLGEITTSGGYADFLIRINDVKISSSIGQIAFGLALRWFTRDRELEFVFDASTGIILGHLPWSRKDAATMPEEIDGVVTRGIAADAFNGNTALDGIFISGIPAISIGSRAFANCKTPFAFYNHRIDATFGEHVFPEPADEVTLWGYLGSSTEQYASDNGHVYSELPSEMVFEIDPETGIIIKIISGRSATIEIPAVIDSINVTGLAPNLFSEYKLFPSGAGVSIHFNAAYAAPITIGESAFEGIEGIFNVIIYANSVAGIGDNAFKDTEISELLIVDMNTVFGTDVLAGTDVVIKTAVQSTAVDYAEANDIDYEYVSTGMVYGFDEESNTITSASGNTLYTIRIPEKIEITSGEYTPGSPPVFADVIFLASGLFDGYEFVFSASVEFRNQYSEPPYPDLTILEGAFIGAIGEFNVIDDQGRLIAVEDEAFKDTEINYFWTTAMTTVFGVDVFAGTSVTIKARTGSTAIAYAIANSLSYVILEE